MAIWVHFYNYRHSVSINTMDLWRPRSVYPPGSVPPLLFHAMHLCRGPGFQMWQVGIRVRRQAATSAALWMCVCLFSGNVCIRLSVKLGGSFETNSVSIWRHLEFALLMLQDFRVVFPEINVIMIYQRQYNLCELMMKLISVLITKVSPFDHRFSSSCQSKVRGTWTRKV